MKFAAKMPHCSSTVKGELGTIVPVLQVGNDRHFDQSVIQSASQPYTLRATLLTHIQCCSTINHIVHNSLVASFFAKENGVL